MVVDPMRSYGRKKKKMDSDNEDQESLDLNAISPSKHQMLLQSKNITPSSHDMPILKREIDFLYDKNFDNDRVGREGIFTKGPSPCKSPIRSQIMYPTGSLPKAEDIERIRAEMRQNNREMRKESSDHGSHMTVHYSSSNQEHTQAYPHIQHASMKDVRWSHSHQNISPLIPPPKEVQNPDFFHGFDRYSKSMSPSKLVYADALPSQQQQENIRRGQTMIFYPSKTTNQPKDVIPHHYPVSYIHFLPCHA